jgi:hypothetical protein
MTNIFDKLANAAVDGLQELTATVKGEVSEVVDWKPLVSDPEVPVSDKLGNRGLGDLKRFVLPSFKSRFFGFATEGSSNRVLHNLPRDVGRALTVNFPDPVYAIWLDPSWTTPGAQIAVAYQGSNRGDFHILTPGSGINFGTAVSTLRFFNADGLEQVLAYTDTSDGLGFPYGYASFLIAVSEKAASLGPVFDGGSINVSPLIGFNTYGFASSPSVDPPVDGLANADKHAFGVGATKRIRIQAIPTVGGARALGGFSLTLTPWFIDANDLSGGSPPIALDSLLIANTGTGAGPYNGTWLKGVPISMSSVGKTGTGTVCAGISKTYAVPKSAMALTFSMLGTKSSDSNATGIDVRYYAE